jgi:hypothetical protein
MNLFICVQEEKNKKTLEFIFFLDNLSDKYNN